MIREFFWILRRDLKLLAGEAQDWLAVLSFFLLLPFTSILGLGLGFEITLRFALVMLAVSQFMAIIFSLDRLFQQDQSQGTLDIIRLMDLPLPVAVLAKFICSWAVNALPITLLVPPLLMLMAGVSAPLLIWVKVFCLFGMVGLCLIFLGGILAALAVSARRAHLLMPLLLLPLSLPLLIFGVASAESAIMGYEGSQPYLFLVALFLVAAILSPWAAARSLDLLD